MQSSEPERGLHSPDNTMNNRLKFLIALAAATVVVLAVRALAFTVYAVNGTGSEPVFIDGDRILVSRWSYGLRTGGNFLFGYERWMAAPVMRGDIAVFNAPLPEEGCISSKEVIMGQCTGVPGDSIRIGNSVLTLPGRNAPMCVTAANSRLVCFIYNRYEGRKAVVAGGRMYVDGKRTDCATFKNDYYRFSVGGRDAREKGADFCLVPETHVIGKPVMLLYSIDFNKPFHEWLRPGRNLLICK